jgi:PAT family beta-lactamase induction signal transducer AmpG
MAGLRAAAAADRGARSGGEGKSYFATLAETGRDVFTLIKTRIGLLACFIMLRPIGSGGLQQLWGAIAKDWGARADEGAVVGGPLSGRVSIPGCIAGRYIADRIDRMRAYALFGIALSVVAVGMALTPHTLIAFLISAASTTASSASATGPIRR